MLPLNILVADEDIDSRIILRALLERAGFAVIEATNADGALEHAQRRALDLVILNYPMADRDGVSLARRLRDLPVTTQVPILNLTSRVVPQFFQQAAQDGVDVSLPKPIDVSSIMDVISRLTKRPLSAI